MRNMRIKYIVPDAGMYSIYICTKKNKTSKLHLGDATQNLLCLFIDHFTPSNSQHQHTHSLTLLHLIAHSFMEMQLNSPRYVSK